MTKHIFKKAAWQPVWKYRCKAGDQPPRSTVVLSQKTHSTSHEKRRVRYDNVVPGAYLTAQEARCLRALLEQGRYAKVAETLDISTRTVEAYLTNIRRKFQCRNKCDVIRLFHRIGIERKERIKTPAESGKT